MYFPSNFSVCGVGLVRNSVDELFVEGTCNVFGVDVCVVFESYGVVALLWWSLILSFFTTNAIKTNMCHIHTSILSRHLAARSNNKILRTPPPLAG